MSQGRRQDQIDTNEKLTALVLLAGIAGVIVGVVWQAFVWCAA